MRSIFLALAIAMSTDTRAAVPAGVAPSSNTPETRTGHTATGVAPSTRSIALATRYAS